MNTNIKTIHCLARVTCALTAIFLLTHHVEAQSTALPTDVIESPKVKKADIPQHFRRHFNREPTSGELKYWESRLKEKPTEIYFLGAMGYWAAKKSSPTLQNSNFTLTLSGTGHDVIQGQTRRHTVTLKHTNPIAQSGYLDLKTNGSNVTPTTPLPNTQRTIVGGLTRLRHRYTLPPNTELSVNFIVTAPAPPTLTFAAILPGRGLSRQHHTTVYKALPASLAGKTYQEREIPLIFARVFGRTPTAKELTHWRSRLKKTKRLETLQGAMEVHQKKGTTMPGVVRGAQSAVNIKDTNRLFRSVFGRPPTSREWHYWAGRLVDKADYPAYLGAMEYHKVHHVTP